MDGCVLVCAIVGGWVRVGVLCIVFLFAETRLDVFFGVRAVPSTQAVVSA